MSDYPDSYFVDENHPMLCGMVAAALMYLQAKLAENEEDAGEFTVTPYVDDNGQFTNQIHIDRPSGRYILTIDKEDD